MKTLKWLGHAAFLLVSDEGLRIVTDPFGKDVPYPAIDVTADVVTVSHQHFDHNASGLVKGNPIVLEGVVSKGAGVARIDRVIRDTRFRTVSSFHDAEHGTRRGPNAVFVIADASTTVCHLGDLGHVPDDEKVREIGPVDVLLVPVGGHYTIGPEEAWAVVSRLKPRVVIPMHYRTRYAESWPIAAVDEFIRGRPGVKKLESSEVAIDRQSLPDATEVVVPEPPASR